MANETIRARIEVLLRGLDQVESLKNAVKQLKATAAPASADLERLKNAATQLGSASGRTENDLRRSINALKDVRAQLSLTDAEYRKLTGTINKYQAQLDKATGAQQQGGRGMRFAQTAGAVAASGVFGGPEGLIGAGVGAFFGPGGALAGGAIGAQVSQIRQQLGATATLAADLEKQRTALRLVLKDVTEYDSAIKFLAKTSKDYAIPQDQLIKGFTQLAASVKGAGGNIEDTKTAFQGVTAGIRGTGGSLESLDAALLATSQVFSKGKVTAEELRGQIGERLPGAFTLFAQSLGKTPQELDKALERGEVSLQDFLTFSKTVFGEYGENAKIIADSPAAAGDRLQTNLKNLGESVGRLLQPIGASFQDTFSSIVKYIDEAARRLGSFLGLDRTNAQKIGDLNNIIITQQKAIERERKKLSMGIVSRDAADYSIRNFEGRIAKVKGELGVLRALEKAGANQDKDNKSGLGGTSSKGDLDRKALDKAEKERQRLAAEQQRLDEQLARTRIALDDAVHRNAMELIRKQYEYALELDQKRRDNWIKSQTGAARSAAGLIAGFLGEADSLGARGFGAKEAVKAAEQQLKSAQAMAATTIGAVGSSGSGGLSFSASQLQTASREASKFTGIANMCSESVKAFYKSLGVSLPGVTAWADTVRKAGQVMTDWSKLQPGDIVATGRPGDTPHVGVYTGGNNVFHQSRSRGLTVGNYPDLDYFKSGYFVRPNATVSGKPPTGMAAAIRRDVSAEGAANVAQADLEKAQQLFKAEQEQIKNLKTLVGEGFVLDFTQQIREQNAEMQNSAQITELRNRLQLEGQRPEYIDGEVKKAEVAQRIAQENEAARQALEKLTDAGEGGSAEAKRLSEAMAANNLQLAEFKRLTDEATAAQTAFNDAMRVRQDNRIGLGLREGAQQYVESIGTMREATAQLAQTGIKGVEDAIFSLVTTGTANFREFAASILKDTARMIIQQLILRTLMQAIGAIGGGGFGKGYFDPITGKGTAGPNFGLAMGGVIGRDGLQPFAMGGIVTKPTLFRYANGGVPGMGLMGEAGPEAIIPLRRGRDGKLGVASNGGGSPVTVNVSVDAKGTSVQGNGGQGEALGRAISAAVQAELIKQRRPGGLLVA